MDLFDIVILSVIQGFTEFLPLSSSAHLVLIPEILSIGKHPVIVDVSLHMGTLFGSIFYFRKDIVKLCIGFFEKGSKEREYVLYLFTAFVPIVIGGLLLINYIEVIRDPKVIALIVLSAVLVSSLLVYFFSNNVGKFKLGKKRAFVIGLAQVLSLFPGVSRSGATILTGISLGLSRKEATRFSFLLAIPTISAAFVLVSIESLSESVYIDWYLLLLGFFISFTLSVFVIHHFLRLVEKIDFRFFFAYQIILASLFIFIF